MIRWSEILERARWLLFRRSEERELREELRFHLAMETEQNVRAGMAPAEARRRAHLKLGGAERFREQVRDARGMRPLEDLVADVRSALRHFRRTPIATGTVLLILALGIGANLALFAVVHSANTLPAPGIARDASLVRVRGFEELPSLPVPRVRSMSYPEVAELAARRDVFAGLTAYHPSSAVLDLGDGRETAPATLTFATPSYFELLGVAPVLGSPLPKVNEAVPDEALAVISHALWDQHFGRSAAVLGSTLRIDELTVRIVGVAPPGFGGTGEHARELQVWVPLRARALLEGSSAHALESPDSAFLSVVARLAPGVSASRAEAVARVIAARAAAQRSEPPRAQAESDVVPLLAHNHQPGGGSDATQLIYFAPITLLILLVTCTNVSGLLVGLAVARRREIAVRLSLGAGRRRVIRQLLTESMLLSLAAGTLGLAVLWLLVYGTDRRLPGLQVEVSWEAVLLMSSVALAAGVLFGLSPALHASRVGVTEVLKDSAATVAGRRSWLQRGLVAGQIALTQPLLVALGASLLIVAGEMRRRPSNPVHEQVATIRFDTWSSNLSNDQRRARLEEVLERLRGLPGVLGAVPQQGGYMLRTMEVHPKDRVAGGRAAEGFLTLSHPAPPGYFALMGIPVVRGRDFTAAEDHPEPTSIIIASDLARELWGAADPIGRRLRSTTDADFERVVVGVVDARAAGDSHNGRSFRVFVPHARAYQTLLIRTAGPAEPMVPLLRAVASAAAPELPITLASTLAAEEARLQGRVLRGSGVAGMGGLLALLLSAIGLYAVVALAVRQRHREIGVRRALGAERREIVRLFLGGGLRVTLLGLAVGLPISLVVLRILTVRLALPEAGLLPLGAWVAGLVLAVASLASWLPARRAAAVDPQVALRAE